MCEVKTIKADQVSSAWLNRQLKNFPKCGIKYGNDNGHGFVLISPSLKMSELHLIEQKVEAAKMKGFKSICKLFIPYQLGRPHGLYASNIPTLTDVVR